MRSPRGRVQGRELGTGLRGPYLIEKKKTDTHEATNKEQPGKREENQDFAVIQKPNIDTVLTKGVANKGLLLVPCSSFAFPGSDIGRELTLRVTSGTGPALPHSVAQAASTKCWCWYLSLNKTG